MLCKSEHHDYVYFLMQLIEYQQSQKPLMIGVQGGYERNEKLQQMKIYHM